MKFCYFLILPLHHSDPCGDSLTIIKPSYQTCVGDRRQLLHILPGFRAINFHASFDFIGYCSPLEIFSYPVKQLGSFNGNQFTVAITSLFSNITLRIHKIISCLCSSPLLSCVTGGSLGAAGSNTCFNYDTTTKTDLRILGEELGEFCGIIVTFHAIFSF